MEVVRIYIDRGGWGSGWRRMIVARRTKKGGAYLLEPASQLRSLRVDKYALEQVWPVEADQKWLRAHLREWAKLARKQGRIYARSLVREVLK